jgi:hypothetical protein
MTLRTITSETTYTPLSQEEYNQLSKNKIAIELLKAALAANSLYYRKAITADEYAAATSYAQIRSKEQLVETFNLYARQANVAYLGGWFGFGPMLLYPSASRIYSVDISKEACDAAKILREEQRLFNLYIERADAITLARDWYSNRNVDVVINTSCEHFHPENLVTILLAASQGGVNTFILQSTNMQHPEHINVMESFEGFTDFISRISDMLALEGFRFDTESIRTVLLYGQERYTSVLCKHPS